jgi:uncharacterized SAM-binding protein YcdF (DUF218 family)
MRRRLAQRALVLVAVLVPLAVLLAHLPTFLVASDPLPPSADAIFVFAGDVPERARCAAELHRRGLAPLVVFSGSVVRPELAAVGQRLSEAELNAHIAREAGLPTAATVVLPEGTSTWEDAEVLRRWSESTGARRLVAVTSALHARRARRTLQLVLAGTDVEVALIACGRRLGPGSRWWLEERSLVAVANEALKLGLYSIRYFAPAAMGLRDQGQPPKSTP